MPKQTGLRAALRRAAKRVSEEVSSAVYRTRAAVARFREITPHQMISRANKVEQYRLEGDFGPEVFGYVRLKEGAEAEAEVEDEGDDEDEDDEDDEGDGIEKEEEDT